MQILFFLLSLILVRTISTSNSSSTIDNPFIHYFGAQNRFYPFNTLIPSTLTPNNNLDNEILNESKLLLPAIQKFTLNLFKSLYNNEIVEQSPGIIFSPFSIWSSLFITYLGAKNTTEQELGETLNIYNLPKDDMLKSYKSLKNWFNQLISDKSLDQQQLNNIDLLNNQTKNQIFSLANRIYFNKKLKLNNYLKTNFKDEVDYLDFKNDPQEARRIINDWVAEKTHNKIQNLLQQHDVNSFTNIIIANAIYFQAKWLAKFDPQKSFKGKFYVNPTEEIEVTYMHQTSNFMYGISEKIKSTILELPYSDQKFSMILILPDPQMGIDNLVKQLRITHLNEIFNNLYEDEVQVQIPKFKFKRNIELAGPLYSLGMQKVFDHRYSDFSGFLEESSNNINNNLNLTRTNNLTLDYEINDLNNTIQDELEESEKKIIINAIVHKAFITVDEEGTEAAAATALLVARSGRPAFLTQFIANRPFMFLIKDITKNIISFMGIVRRPGESKDDKESF